MVDCKKYDTSIFFDFSVGSQSKLMSCLVVRLKLCVQVSLYIKPCFLVGLH